MKKIIFSLLLSFTFISSLNADYLLASKNKCITDYYYSRGFIYYHYSYSPTVLRSSSAKKYQSYIFDGYVFNPVTNTCNPDPKLLGLSPSQFELVNASIAFFIVIILIGSLL